MGFLTRASDLVYTFRFLRLLTTPFKSTSAFKLGLIDEDGNRIKTEPLDTSEKKSSYSPFHRIVYNIKRLIAKAPGGSSTVASYASALYLVKEQNNLSERDLNKILAESNIDISSFLSEESQWFLLENKRLSPGIYTLGRDKVLSESFDDVVRAKDKIRVGNAAAPVGEIFGMDVYEAIHVNTNKTVHITIGEISR